MATRTLSNAPVRNQIVGNAGLVSATWERWLLQLQARVNEAIILFEEADGNISQVFASVHSGLIGVRDFADRLSEASDELAAFLASQHGLILELTERLRVLESDEGGVEAAQEAKLAQLEHRMRRLEGDYENNQVVRTSLLLELQFKLRNLEQDEEQELPRRIGV